MFSSNGAETVKVCSMMTANILYFTSHRLFHSLLCRLCVAFPVPVIPPLCLLRLEQHSFLRIWPIRESPTKACGYDLDLGRLFREQGNESAIHGGENDCYRKVSQVFRINEFNIHQKKPIDAITLEKKDVSRNLPTDSGTSLIFQAIPLMFDLVNNNKVNHWIITTICNQL